MGRNAFGDRFLDSSSLASVEKPKAFFKLLPTIAQRFSNVLIVANVEFVFRHFLSFVYEKGIGPGSMVKGCIQYIHFE